MATEIHVKGALSSTTGYEAMPSRGICAQQGGRLKGRTGSVVLAHSFIAVDRPALVEV